jgi:hypothetical protein
MLPETQITAFTTFTFDSCPSDAFFSGHSAWFCSMVGDTAGRTILHLHLHLLHISPTFLFSDQNPMMALLHGIPYLGSESNDSKKKNLSECHW